MAVAGTLFIALETAGTAQAAPRVFSGVADATKAFNAMKTAIGGPDNTTKTGPQRSGFRTINWDGVKLDETDFNGNSQVIIRNKIVGIPVDRFESRGIIFDERDIDIERFTLAGSNKPARTRGFGAIFLDVERSKTTSIEYFSGSTSLGKYYVPPGGNRKPVFLGVLWDNPIVTSVKLLVGKAQIFSLDGKTVRSGPADITIRPKTVLTRLHG